MIANVCLLLLAAAAAAPQERREGWVVLPIEEYKALRAKADPPEPAPEPPPVEAAIARIEYELEVAGDSAAGEARLTVDVFKAGWVRVPIPQGLLVREARIDGRPVSLVDPPQGRGGDSAPYVLLSKTGRSTLTLEIAAPLTSASGTETLVLPGSTAAVTRATLVVPRAGVDVTASGGLVSERTEAAGRTRCVVFGRSGERLTLSWRRRIADRRSELPLRYRGAVTQLVALGEEAAQVSAEVRIEVLQGQAASVLVELPEGFAVNEVSSASVGDWQVSARGLTVTFLEPAAREAAFTVVGESRTPREGPLGVPLLRLPAAERETGGVAVEVTGEGEIKSRQAKAMEDADPSDLGDIVARRASPSLSAFRYRPVEGRTPRSLVVEVARYTPEAVLVAVVEEARYRVLLTEDGKTLVEARYVIRNNQQSFLKLALPQGATLWSASLGSRSLRPGRAPDGALLLPLEKGRSGEEAPAFVLQATYLERAPTWSPKGRARFVLPALDMPVSSTGLELFHSPRFRVTPQPGAFRAAPYEPAGAALQMGAGRDEELGAGRKDDRERRANEKKEADAVQSLVDKLQKSGRVTRVAGVLPVQVPFPAMGPLLFFAAELTTPEKPPSLELDYERSKGK